MTTRAHWQRTFVDTSGNVRVGLSVTVRDESTGALAALFDRNDNPKSNPLTTDGFGYADFYVEPGRYRILADSIDWRDEEIVSFSALQSVIEALEEGIIYAGTVTEAKEIEGLIEGQQISVSQGGSMWMASASPTIPPNGVTVVESSGTPGMLLEMLSGELSAPADSSQTTHPQSMACFEIRVPSHLPTQNEALEYLSRFSVRSGTWVDILLEDSYVMREQVFISARNFGWVTIFGTDNDRDFEIDGDFLTANRTQDVYGVTTRAAYTVVQGGQGPRIGCRFNMINAAPDSSVETGRKHGIFVSGPGSGCNIMNFRAFRNCGDHGVYANRGGYINCYGVDVSGCGRTGVYANRATIDAQQANADDCGDVGILALYNGAITAFGATANRSGVRSGFGSKVIFNDGVAEDVNGSALSATDGGEIEAANASVSRAAGTFGRGCDAQGGGKIVFVGGKANDCGQYGLHATGSGVVEGAGSEAQRAGSAGVQASAGGRINIGNALTRRDTSTDGNADIRVLSGGYITAVGAQGGTNVAPMSISLGGIIIK